MKILVIGGAGYIGSVLVQQLLESGHEVRVLDTLLYGNLSIKNLSRKAEIIIEDFRNLYITRQAMKGVDVVIHLAAIVGDSACNLYPPQTFDINFHSAVSLAKLAKKMGIPVFIFSSTCSVYGYNDKLLTENSTPNPLSTYAESKIFAEENILQLSDKNMAIGVPRFGTVYGASPRMRYDLVVNLLTAKAIADKKITIFGGEQWRPFLHVKDAARGILHLLSLLQSQGANATGIYNIGSSRQNLQLFAVADLLQSLFPDIQVNVQKKDENERNYRVDFTKIEKSGYAAKWSLAEGISQIARHFKEKNIRNYENSVYNNYRHLRDNGIRSK